MSEAELEKVKALRKKEEEENSHNLIFLPAASNMLVQELNKKIVVLNFRFADRLGQIDRGTIKPPPTRPYSGHSWKGAGARSNTNFLKAGSIFELRTGWAGR